MRFPLFHVLSVSLLAIVLVSWPTIGEANCGIPPIAPPPPPRCAGVEPVCTGDGYGNWRWTFVCVGNERARRLFPSPKPMPFITRDPWMDAIRRSRRAQEESDLRQLQLEYLRQQLR